jgi:hypothetical protein
MKAMVGRHTQGVEMYEQLIKSQGMNFSANLV